MGWPMATCLVRAGYRVTVYDARTEQSEKFASEVGGAAAASLAELARNAEVLVTILPNSDIVESVLFGEAGIAAALPQGATIIDMTSGVPAKTVRFAERLAEDGRVLFDAPVSGGVARARTGELTIMAGGEDEVVQAALPVLKAMGNVIRTGVVGSGHAMKALNNLVSAGGFLIGVEALLIGSKFGIDPEVIVDTLNSSTGMNNSTQKKFRQFVLSRGFNSGFALELMVKDLVIALGVAHDAKVNAPFANLCKEMWSSASAVLGPGTDHTALARFSELLAGSQIPERQS
ncbi:hydroxyacid oxidoreductase [Devosia chinhatensis]|uniref:Hydroxyacid oxidoreductase n=2 Tax=Devosia chinhatensis TaxID=429727 RepID=A0A0F5FNV3_9HYPH|nr:hydroxyacid oxidoreductase [Devosia chinhatensis]